MTLLAVLLLSQGTPDEIRVKDVRVLRAALAGAPAGTKILIEPGEYEGGHYFENLHGTAAKPIVIAGTDPENPPRFVGGNSAFQLSKVSHLEIRDLIVERPTANGLNIDDGGSYTKPSHHVTIRNVRVTDLPKGNHDGIKLSGVDDFRVENVVIERWGGSGIDMVGCHRGVVTWSTFRSGGDSGIQCKGGTSEIRIERNKFENYGHRGVNIGGSTGQQFFRPPIEKMPAGRRYEAKEITVAGNTFSGGVAPVAFVGADGSTVRFNTIYHPEKWALRILQETSTATFVGSRNGVFEDNLVVFKSNQWVEGGVNIGPATRPQTFRFARNFWFCSDRPERSTPRLPTVESNGITGVNPKLRNPEKGDFAVEAGSPAAKVGAHAFR